MATVVTCQHCIHWMQLRPGQLQYRRATDGLAGHCLNPGNIGKGLGTVSHTSTCDLAEEPNRKPTCQTCAFWEHRAMSLIGDCTNPKLVFTGQGARIPIDGLGCYVPERARNFQTGEAFSCIHHQPRT